MKKQIIDKYIKLNITCDNVKKFVRELSDDNEYLKLNKIKIRIVSFMVSSNGCVSAFKWRKKYYFTIFVNVYPYLRNEKLTNRMKWFYIYVTILHEIKHINLLMRDNCEWDYSTYLALIEENNIKTASIPRMIQWIMPRNKDSKKIYSTSSVELICRYQSIESAYNIFEIFLVAQEKKKIKMLIESAQFLRDYIEIAYSYSGIPYNKFNTSIILTQRLFGKRYNLLKKYPELQYIYTLDGKIKSIDKIYEKRTNENSDFIDNIMLQMFINFDADYSKILDNNICLKKHLEFLVNQYCKKCIYYIEKIEIGTVFLKREILEENALLLLKNVKYINELMIKYRMNHTEENIFLIE